MFRKEETKGSFLSGQDKGWYTGGNISEAVWMTEQRIFALEWWDWGRQSLRWTVMSNDLCLAFKS